MTNQQGSSAEQGPITPSSENIDIEKVAHERFQKTIQENGKKLFLGLIVALLLITISALFISSSLAWVIGVGIIFILFIASAENYSSVERVFWKKFADDHHWKYEETGSCQEEKAILFTAGISRQMRNTVSGVVDNHPIRIFQYSFNIQQNKQKKVYSYTVFEFKFSGRFPHFYLNRHDDQFGSSTGEKVSLPTEFEKEFTLYAPRQYEIEAHQIFNPEILSYILDSDLRYDVELVDEKLFIFKNYHINNRADLEKEFDKAHALALKLAPILDNFRFEKIGDHSPELS